MSVVMYRLHYLPLSLPFPNPVRTSLSTAGNQSTVVPFKGQSASWSMVEQQRYAYILSKADDVVHLSDDYFNGCYFKRNDYMLSHSSSVIAYFDGKPKGGTAYTCRKAREKRMPVVNVY